jgi:NitT/TauT family transport system ATP-binding protein
MIRFEGVSLVYHTREGETKALADVNFSVAPREFVGIVGPSGCGKSTVLSLIAGLVKPTVGRVLVDGEEVRGPGGRVGYMLQQDCLYEWRTILGNALLGLEVRGAVTREAVE